MLIWTTRAAILAVLLGLLEVVVLAQGTLSEQVLQLLTRTSTWSGQQTFQNLRVPGGAIPSDTSVRIYADVAGNLYYNGGLIAGAGGGVVPHNLLSTTHPDTLAASPPTRGDLLVANSTPAWARFAKGAVGTFLQMGASDPAWSADGSTLTGLNATSLASGTVALARLPTTISNAQIDAAAAIAWTKLSKTGSSLADLTTRSASDLSAGTVADARLSANVSLFGTAVDTSEIASGAVTAPKLADFGCAAGQAMTWQLAGWTCGTFGTGSGSVTSVALSLPAIFTVTGSPVTTTGTLTGTLATQTANLVWAGPTVAPAAAPTFRALVNADLPTSGVGAGTYAVVTVNTRGVVTSATAQASLTANVSGILPLANGGTGLSSAVDDTTLVSSGAAWVATTLGNCANGLAYATATNTFSCVTTPTFTTLTVSTTSTHTGNATFSASIIGDGTTDATSTITGAVQTDGGLGVVKALWVGGLANIAGATTLQGALIGDATTDSTSISTGAFQTDGGLGVTKALWVGGLLNVAGAVTLQGVLGVTGLTTATGGIQIGAAGNAIVGVFTGTATYDPGAVADQTSVTTTLTVTGAAVGQTCEAALSTIDGENLSVSAFPSGADTVRVVVGNLSGGPLTPGSGTLRATCMAF